MPQLNKYSSRITQPKSQGLSQAMLYGTGLSEEDARHIMGLLNDQARRGDSSMRKG